MRTSIFMDARSRHNSRTPFAPRGPRRCLSSRWSGHSGPPPFALLALDYSCGFPLFGHSAEILRTCDNKSRQVTLHHHLILGHPIAQVISLSVLRAHTIQNHTVRQYQTQRRRRCQIIPRPTQPSIESAAPECPVLTRSCSRLETTGCCAVCKLAARIEEMSFQQ